MLVNGDGQEQQCGFPFILKILCTSATDLFFVMYIQYRKFICNITFNSSQIALVFHRDSLSESKSFVMSQQKLIPLVIIYK